jgi:uncharacterized protein
MPERRMCRGAEVRLERRSADDSKEIIVGHASVYDQWTTLYEGRYWVWREIVRPGAYRNALAEKQDVRGLWNHDANYVLGRTKSGTVELSDDGTGLLSRIDWPDTQTIRDLVVEPIRRGDVTGMSFAFSVRRSEKVTRTELPDGTEVIDAGGERITLREENGRRIEERELLDLDLFDVSPVTYPAYEGTDVGLRSATLGLDLARRIEEMDRPRQRPAPHREKFRRWLEGISNGSK